jgi:hypothetical protein
MCQSRARYLLTSSHTFQGYATFIPDLLKGLSRLYIIQGSPGTGKATLIRGSGMQLLEKGYEVEFWLSALDPSSFDGWYLPLRRTAVVSGTLPALTEVQVPWVRTINLDTFLTDQPEALQPLLTQLTQQDARVRACLEQAAGLQRQVETRYRAVLDPERLEALHQELTQAFNIQETAERHMFATAVTPEGVVSDYDLISRGCRRRYLLTGPAIIGSLLLETLAGDMRRRGFTLEYYHRGTDRGQLGMVLVPALKLAVMITDDAVIRHKPGDVAVSLNDLFLPELADTSREIEERERDMRVCTAKAMQNLRTWAARKRDIERIYRNGMDFAPIDQLQAELVEDIARQPDRLKELIT